MTQEPSLPDAFRLTRTISTSYRTSQTSPNHARASIVLASAATASLATIHTLDVEIICCGHGRYRVSIIEVGGEVTSGFCRTIGV